MSSTPEVATPLDVDDGAMCRSVIVEESEEDVSEGVTDAPGGTGGEGGAGGSGGEAGASGAAGSGGAAGNQEMSFFVTSTSRASGNFSGLSGADEWCQSLVALAPVSSDVKQLTWRAYLSTTQLEDGSCSTGAPPAEQQIAARDRIGDGPWYNFDGELIALDVGALHADGIDTSQMLTEAGEVLAAGEAHVATGSDAQGNIDPNAFADADDRTAA